MYIIKMWMMESVLWYISNRRVSGKEQETTHLLIPVRRLLRTMQSVVHTVRSANILNRNVRYQSHCSPMSMVVYEA